MDKHHMNIKDLLKDRNETHGDWPTQSHAAQEIKGAIACNALHAPLQEALEMMAVKLSRIRCGDAYIKDHWDDIAGYATLASQWIAEKEAEDDAKSPV